MLERTPKAHAKMEEMTTTGDYSGLGTGSCVARTVFRIPAIASHRIVARKRVPGFSGSQRQMLATERDSAARHALRGRQTICLLQFRMLLANLSIILSVSFPNVGGSPKGCKVSEQKKLTTSLFFLAHQSEMSRHPACGAGTVRAEQCVRALRAAACVFGLSKDCSSLKMMLFSGTITYVIPSQAALSCCQRGAPRGSRFRHCRFFFVLHLNAMRACYTFFILHCMVMFSRVSPTNLHGTLRISLLLFGNRHALRELSFGLSSAFLCNLLLRSLYQSTLDTSPTRRRRQLIHPRNYQSTPSLELCWCVFFLCIRLFGSLCVMSTEHM